MLVPSLVIGGLVIIYITTYTLNKRTPIPEECREIVDKAKCTSCKNFACGLKS